MSDEAKQYASTELTTVRAELAELQGWSIENEDDNAFAGEMLINIKKRHKVLEEKRKTVSVPMNQALKAFNDLFREPRGLLEQAEQLLKSKIAGYLEAVEVRNAAALQAAGEADSVDAATAAMALVETAEAPKGVSVRYEWVPRIINESMLDRRFLVPDLEAIKSFAKAHRKPDGEPVAIPGVLFDKRPIVSARTKGA